MKSTRNLATLALGATLGCGGGGGPSTSGGRGGLDPLAPKTGALTLTEQQHLLRRTSFGTPPAELARLQAVGLSAYVEELLDFSEDSALETAALGEFKRTSHPEKDEMVRWWLHLMTKTKRPFKEALAFFWHDHFATSHVNMSNGQRHWMLDHVRLIRRKGGGNLRELLRDLTKDPAMLFWLDGYKSTRQAPNENFAREFWELFTLGVDNGYTQADIEEASRAFTGYELRFVQSVSQWKMIWKDSRHDDTAKEFFGRSGRFGYNDVVDVTLAERPVAEFLCRRLWSWLCHDDPDPAIVDRLATMLRKSDYELAPVLRTILRSNAFFSDASRRPKVKSPVEYLVGFVRTTGLTMPLTELSRDLGKLAHQPTLPPGVDGWPTGEQWLSSASMLQRSNAVHRIVTARAHQGSFDLGQLVPDGSRTSEGVVDTLLATLALEVGTAERMRFVELLDSSVVERGGKLDVQSSPFDWQNTRHRDERVRGLLHVLAQHPSYHTR